MSEVASGRFCWYELMTTDPRAAPSFYGQVAGWATLPFDGAIDEPYEMWTNRGTPIGGLVRLPPEATADGVPPHWMAHVSTPDLEATLSNALRQGGQVMVSMTIPTVGRFAILRDPQGAVISAYEPEGDAPGHDGPPAIGEFSWSELATSNWQEAWAFYSELFGWSKGEVHDMGEMGTYQLFDNGARPLGGMFDRPAEAPVSSWLHYIRVPDVHAAAATVTELGGRVLSGPMEVPGGDMVAQCVDPQGAAFALHQSGAGSA